ncbi:Crp/Fnr family transcriptional regulator [Paenibacillus oralis]|nr:Crp/Fnr family transcriptional regulator [Paenibacillus oralis]
MLLHARFNQIILMEQHKVYEIEKGLAFIWSVRSDGKQSLTDILHHGMAAEFPDTPDTVYEVRAQTASRIRIHALEPASLSPEQMVQLLTKLRAHSWRSLQLAMICRQKYISERLNLFMAFLNQQFGVEFRKTQRLIPFVLTHENIANAINSTRSTVTRMMNELEQKGQISHVQLGKNRLIVFPSAPSSEVGRLVQTDPRR